MNARPIRRCRRRSCRKEHTNINPHCSYECASADALESLRRNRLKRTKAARAEKREYRARTMSLGKLKAAADREFGRYIRERDYYLPCISSGETNPPMTMGGQWDCGHYRSK